MQDYDESQYHASQRLVYADPDWALEIVAILGGVNAAEMAAIPLGQIGLALHHSWSSTVVALAFCDTAALRPLINEARQS